MNPSDAAAPRLDLGDFTLGQMLRCGLDIRKATKMATGMEAAARAIVRHLYEATGANERGEPTCPLVRFYKTHPLEMLTADLRQHVEESSPVPLGSATPCLTLLATAGEEPDWNDRRRSEAHRAIPLASAEAVSEAPMISRLLEQFGVNLSTLLDENADESEGSEGRNYDIFYVADAAGSPYIPAQDFVRDHAIASVVGFGGVLRTGDMFAVILFSRTPVPVESAQRFKPVALDVRSALFRFTNEQVFDA
jgi:hypothetical protein